MERVQRVVKQVEPHDSVERYSDLGVECIQGEAKITSPWSVTVNGRTLTTRAIIIAAGARPLVPPIPGLDKVEVPDLRHGLGPAQAAAAAAGARRRADRLRAGAGVRAPRLAGDAGRDAAARSWRARTRRFPSW